MHNFQIIKAPYPHFNSRRLTFSSDFSEIEVFGHYYTMEYGKKSLKLYTEFSRVYLSVHHFELNTVYSPSECRDITSYAPVSTRQKLGDVNLWDEVREWSLN